VYCVELFEGDIQQCHEEGVEVVGANDEFGGFGEVS